MDEKGANVQQLTNMPCDCGAPHFSHDGKKITLFANLFGNYDIFWMDETGNNIERLTNNPAQDGYPIFSSDKRKIVFHSNRSGKYQIYWIDLMSPLNYDQLVGALEQAIETLEEMEKL